MYSMKYEIKSTTLSGKVKTTITTITDPMSVTSKFNSYFKTIGPKLSNKIQNLDQHFSAFMQPKV